LRCVTTRDARHILDIAIAAVALSAASAAMQARALLSLRPAVPCLKLTSVKASVADLAHPSRCCIQSTAR
jgi:hypothetical protein